MNPQPTKKCILDITVKIKEHLKKKEWPPENGWPEIAAYVFDQSRRLVTKEVLKLSETKLPTTKVKFELPSIRGYYIVAIGPEIENLIKLNQLTVNLRKRTKWPIQKVPGSPGTHKMAFEIPGYAWWCTIKTSYEVSGTVEKDGQPICYGEVDIYDVDVSCFWWLPDLVIEKIREAFIDAVLDRPQIELEKVPDRWYKMASYEDDICPTWPIPPFPPRGPRYMDPDRIMATVKKKMQSLPHRWRIEANKRLNSLHTVKERIDAKMKKMPELERERFLNIQPVKGVTLNQIMYSNTGMFRSLLVHEFQAFRFWLCWYPWIWIWWWPWCYLSWKKVGTAQLQPDGSFSTSIMQSICDTPDLWFVVRQNINGVEKVIYERHPVPCHTYWNHPEGVPIDLIVTDPDAVVCFEEDLDLDPGEKWICPLTVGEYEFLRIYGTGAGNMTEKIGLYSSNGNYKDGPFGGTIGLRIWFSPKFLDENVKYYRIKYQIEGTNTWEALNSDVSWYYVNPNPPPIFMKFELGRNTVNSVENLFKIPPAYSWVKIGHMVHGYLDTTFLSHGYILFKIELFDKDGNRVNPAGFSTSTDSVWKLRDPNKPDPTETTDASNVNGDLVQPTDPEDPAFETFIFKLRIDNRKCDAVIDTPYIIGGDVAGDECGMMDYDYQRDSQGNPIFDPQGNHIPVGSVHISLHANHEATHESPAHSFATFSFVLKRGNIHVTNAGIPPNGLNAEDPASGEINEPQIGVYTGDTHGNFNHDFLISDLLGICDAAAFLEDLHVYAKAINGWSRLDELDARASRAFGLKPGPSEGGSS